MRNFKLSQVAAHLAPLVGRAGGEARGVAVTGACFLGACDLASPRVINLAQIERQLEAWVDLAPDCEAEARLEVRRRIVMCFQMGGRCLDLSHLPLSSLPGAVGVLGHLERLSVLNAGLRELPPEVARLSHLKSLHLGGNDLTHLPPELAALKNLRRLFLNANQFNDLPPWLPSLRRLELLHLQHNCLERVPLSLKSMPWLYDLDLRNNGITHLPDWLRELNLRYLDVSGNPVPDLQALVQRPENRSFMIP